MPMFSHLDRVAESVLPNASRACRMLDVAKSLGVSIVKVDPDELPDGALASIYGKRVFVRTTVAAKMSCLSELPELQSRPC